MARFFIPILALSIISGCQDKAQWNVLIVTFDTTRADHIATYGKASAQTPVLDQLAADGVVYERSLAPIPITLPSHSSIMTGQVPFVHGVRDNGLFKLSEKKLTLAEILKKAGFETGAAIGSFPLTAQFGINQGFDFFNEHITQEFEDIFGERTIAKDKLFFDERKAAQVNDAIMPWIEQTVNNDDAPFFAWAHYFDPHHPHEPPAPYNQSFVHDLYQGEIAYSDESLGNIIQQLKDLGVYDNTMIVFTSDHGEGMNEHNESTHSMLIYNSTVHVPLIVKYPQQQHAGKRVAQWVGSVDILPTILNQLNLPIPEDIQGRILPINDDIDAEVEYYTETLSPRFSRGWGEQRGLVKNGHKYIYGPQKELYNLDSDHAEINNLINKNPSLAEQMKNDLSAYIDEHQLGETHSAIEVDSDTLNTLRGLGYVQSSTQAIDYFEEKLDDTGEAPQQHIATISSYSQAKNLLFSGEYIEANRFLDALLLTDADNLAYLEMKIQADMQLGNFEVAKQTLQNLPDDSYGTLSVHDRLTLLAKIHYFQGDYQQAMVLFEDAENLEITAGGQYFLAQMQAQKNNLAKQQFHLLAFLAIQPQDIKALNDLAISYAQDGQLILAEKTFQKAISNSPYHQLSHYNYATYLHSTGDDASAQHYYAQAIAIDPYYLKAHYALFEIDLSQGQLDAAQSRLQIMRQTAPNHPLTAQAEQYLSTYE